MTLSLLANQLNHLRVIFTLVYYLTLPSHEFISLTQQELRFYSYNCLVSLLYMFLKCYN